MRHGGLLLIACGVACALAGTRAVLADDVAPPGARGRAAPEPGTVPFEGVVVGPDEVLFSALVVAPQPRSRRVVEAARPRFSYGIRLEWGGNRRPKDRPRPEVEKEEAPRELR